MRAEKDSNTKNQDQKRTNIMKGGVILFSENKPCPIEQASHCTNTITPYGS